MIEDLCEEYNWNRRRKCRNKGYVSAPIIDMWGTVHDSKTMCKKHAGERAERYLEYNKHLIWALKELELI